MLKWMAAFALLAVGPVRAQHADCVARPVGPTFPLDLRIDLAGRPGVPSGARGAARLTLGDQAANGTVCGGPPIPTSDDVLHGPPAPRGLLQGDGPRDVLHNRYVPRVTIEPRSP